MHLHVFLNRDIVDAGNLNFGIGALLFCTASDFGMVDVADDKPTIMH